MDWFELLIYRIVHIFCWAVVIIDVAKLALYVLARWVK